MDKAKQKLLDKLGKKGFDTEKKVNAIDMQVAFGDSKPEKREAKHDRDDRGPGNDPEPYNYGG